MERVRCDVCGSEVDVVKMENGVHGWLCGRCYRVWINLVLEVARPQ